MRTFLVDDVREAADVGVVNGVDDDGGPVLLTGGRKSEPDGAVFSGLGSR